MESILETIKNLLGIPEEVDAFNEGVRIGINTAINSLTQIGVGPDEGFSITGPEETWEQFLGNDPRLEQTKEYIFIKTKLLFDPNQMSSIVQASYDHLLKEIEWRLNVQVDSGDDEKMEGGENQNEPNVSGYIS